MANIYELTGEFKALWSLLDEGAIEDDVLAEVFEVTTEELAIKLEGYCKFLKNCEADINGLKAEEQRLAERRRTIENTVARAKAAMQKALETAGEKKMTCGTFSVSLQKNPPRVVIDDPYIENIPERYLMPQEPQINKKLMLEDFKNDGVIPDLEGIAHIEQGESLRIK